MLRSFLFSLSLLSASISFSQLNIDSIGYLDLPTMHNQKLNDIWGYTDEAGNEYALVGGSKGTSVVDISTPSMPNEIFYESGITSTWRDIKTYGDFAFVTTEAQNGLLIIDLSPLPASSILPTAYYFGEVDSIWRSAHNLYIDPTDHYAYIFGANRGNGGVIILDISDPMNPVEAGQFDDWYVHDGYVLNDTMYLGHISDGFMSIVDVQDKANPVLLGTQFTPSNFTHNIWTTGGQYAFTTDEVAGGYIGSYDISDPLNITELDRIQSSPGAGVIPHNTHVLGNYIVTSYYSDGVIVHDVTHPHNLIEVGNYDTYPDQTTSYDGCWGAYPYFPSGLIAASDITEGLYILNPSYVQAAYLEGNITDAVTFNPIDQVDTQIAGNNQVDKSNSSGFYATGIAAGGTYDVTYSKVGYFPETVSLTIVNGVITTQDIQLVPIPPFTLDVVVLELGTNTPIDGAQIKLEAPLLTHNGLTNALGEENFTLFYQELYNVSVGKWGYLTYCLPQVIDASTGSLTVYLKPGIYDDFTFDQGWTTTTDATTGLWERAVPFGTTEGSAPGSDSNSDCNDLCYVTGNAAIDHINFDDVDKGEVVLRSPMMDLSGYTNPYVNYEQWYYCYHGPIPPGDSLEVFVSNGVSSARIDMQGYDPSVHFQWYDKSFRILDHVPLSSTMQFTFRIADYSPNDNITEAAIDQFFIAEFDELGIEPLVGNDLRWYPNPTSDQLKVDGLMMNSNFTIISINGTVVKQGEVSSQNNSVDVSNIEDGVYFIRCKDEVQKVIISK